eukprot:1334456-Pyramimonas_sp.AAC.1
MPERLRPWEELWPARAGIGCVEPSVFVYPTWLLGPAHLVQLGLRPSLPLSESGARAVYS